MHRFLRECAPHRTSHAPPQSACARAPPAAGRSTEGNVGKGSGDDAGEQTKQGSLLTQVAVVRTFGGVDDLVRRRAERMSRRVAARSSLVQVEQAKPSRWFQFQRGKNLAGGGQEWTTNRFHHGRMHDWSIITLVLLLVSRRRDATKAMTTASLPGAAIGVVPLD